LVSKNFVSHQDRFKDRGREIRRSASCKTVFAQACVFYYTVPERFVKERVETRSAPKHVSDRNFLSAGPIYDNE